MSAPKIPALTAKEVRELLAYDPTTGILTWRTRDRSWFPSKNGCTAWNATFAEQSAGCLKRSGYIHVRINGRYYMAHRVAFVWMEGEWPPDQIDHIDHNRSNNSWRNLRQVNHAENHRNRRLPVTNTSGIMGVSWHKVKGKWQSMIKRGGKPAHLGYFDNFDEAALARRSAEVALDFHKNHGAISHSLLRTLGKGVRYTVGDADGRDD